MKNLDLFSKRILIFSVSFSMIFISVRLFIFSISNTRAQKNESIVKCQNKCCGIYQMSLPVHWKNDCSNCMKIFILNTETGVGYWKDCN